MIYYGRKVTLFTLVLVFLSSQSLAQDRVTLTQLLEEVRHENPEIQAAEFNLSAAKARIPQVSFLEDPRVGFKLPNLPLDDLRFNATPMSGKEFSFNQKIPFPSKLIFRRKAEKAAALSQDKISEETANKVIFQVKATYFSLYRIDKEIAIVKKNKALLSNLAKVAEARYTTNQASGPDVFRAQTFHAELQNVLLALEQERESMIVQMNALLNRPADQELRLKYVLPSRMVQKTLDLEIFKDIPLLQAMEARIKEADYRVALAKNDFLPDFDFGFSYRQRDIVSGDPVAGSDFITGSVSLNIPLWAYWRQHQALKEGKALQQVAAFQYQNTRNQTMFLVEDSYKKSARQFRQLNIYERSLLPQSRATYESSYTAYQLRKVDFFSTIEALKDQNETEIAYYDLQSDYHTTNAYLEWVLSRKD